MDYKARFYSPYLNHFIQPDSLIPDPTNPQAFNRFGYVHNNPVNFNDPSGHARCDEDGNCMVGNKSTLGIHAEEYSRKKTRLPIDATAPSNPTLTAVGDISTQSSNPDFVPSGEAMCSAVFGDILPCNSQVWGSYIDYLGEGLAGLSRVRIGFDPSKVDGFQLLLDIAGIGFDLATAATAATPLSPVLAKAGQWLDVAGAGYQLSNAMGGSSGLGDLTIDTVMNGLESYGPQIIKSEVPKTIPLIGSVFHAFSILQNLSQGVVFTTDPDFSTPLITR